mmetsp:Transcript_16531/g.26856  ORF Transcript_16531/g.26856 Transcript_16531/m.26856 type:complete len:121 (+) Transcript_16531:609-971(+)
MSNISKSLVLVKEAARVQVQSVLPPIRMAVIAKLVMFETQKMCARKLKLVLNVVRMKSSSFVQLVSLLVTTLKWYAQKNANLQNASARQGLFVVLLGRALGYVEKFLPGSRDRAGFTNTN